MWITLRPFSEQLVHQHRLSRLGPANLAATSSISHATRGEIERDHDCQKREGQLWLPALDEAVVSHQPPLCVPQSIQFVLQGDAGPRLLLARFNQEFSFHFGWLWPAAAHLAATEKSPGRPAPGSWTTQSSPTCGGATQSGPRWQSLIIKH